MKKVDLIVPCYNEGEVVNMFFDAAKKVTDRINGYEFGFIFVDDGSSDNTLELLKAIADKNNCVKYISFSRNFGKESGMYAGLKNTKADYAVILDADLQHPPELIEQMLKAMEATTAVRQTVPQGTATRRCAPFLQGAFTGL